MVPSVGQMGQRGGFGRGAGYSSVDEDAFVSANESEEDAVVTGEEFFGSASRRTATGVDLNTRKKLIDYRKLSFYGLLTSEETQALEEDAEMAELFRVAFQAAYLQRRALKQEQKHLLGRRES
jgi:hypothetical protein